MPADIKFSDHNCQSVAITDSVPNGLISKTRYEHMEFLWKQTSMEICIFVVPRTKFYVLRKNVN